MAIHFWCAGYLMNLESLHLQFTFSKVGLKSMSERLNNFQILHALQHFLYVRGIQVWDIGFITTPSL